MNILPFILLSLIFSSCASSGSNNNSVDNNKYELDKICRDKFDYLYPNLGNEIIAIKFGHASYKNSAEYRTEFWKQATEYVSICENWVGSDMRKEIFEHIVKVMEKTKQDSIENANFALAKKKSYDEINALIANGTETTLILDKCEKYTTEFNEKLQECVSIRISEKINEITELLKANKLKECINECQQPDLRNASPDLSEKISDLCEKQLSGKVKKLPLKEIDGELVEMYFSPFYESTSFVFQQLPKNSNVQIQGKVLQNDGKKAMLELTRDYDFVVKHSGQCLMREGTYLSGFGKYLGEETFTTVMGAKRTLPVFQLLWCGN